MTSEPFSGYVAAVGEQVETRGEREERLAKNEVLFRSVNEAIEQQAMQFGGLDEYEFICECASHTCVERVPLTLLQYEHIRIDAPVTVQIGPVPACSPEQRVMIEKHAQDRDAAEGVDRVVSAVACDALHGAVVSGEKKFSISRPPNAIAILTQRHRGTEGTDCDAGR